MSHPTDPLGAIAPRSIHAPNPVVDGYLSTVGLREAAQQLDYIASLVAADMAPEGAPDLPADVLRDWGRSMRALIPAAAAAEREGSPGLPYANADFFELGITLEQLRSVVKRDERGADPFSKDGWSEATPSFQNRAELDERFELSSVGVRTRRS